MVNRKTLIWARARGGRPPGSRRGRGSTWIAVVSAVLVGAVLAAWIHGGPMAAAGAVVAGGLVLVAVVALSRGGAPWRT